MRLYLVKCGVVVRAFASAALVGATFTTHAAAQSSDSGPFTRPIELIVGYSAGDTYDIYSRLAARFMPRYLPGRPTIVVRNMQGVGSLKAANYLYSSAPKDGTTIGMLGQGIALDQLVQNSAVQFDARQFNWIGRMVPVIQFVVAWHTAPVKSLEDAMKQQVVVAATSAAGATGTVPRLLNRLAGTNFKIIYGYPGLTGTMLAMERGETQAGTASAQMLLFSRPELMAKPLVSVLVQYSKHRSELFPNVPALGEFGRTEEEKQVLQIYGSTTEFGRSLLAPSGASPDRVRMLRSAFDSMMKDPEFLTELREARLEVGALNGDGVAKIVHETIDVPPSLAQAVARALQ